MTDQGNPQDPNPWGPPPGEQPPPPPPPPPPNYGQQPPQYGPPEPPAQPQYGQPYPTQQLPPFGGEQNPQQPQYPQYGQPGYGETSQLPPTYGPQYGQPGYGDTSQLPPTYGQPGYGTPPPPGGPGGPVVPGPGGGKNRRGLFAGIGVAVVALLAVLAYFLFFAGSSGASSPQDAVKTLMEAGKSLDVNKAKGVLCQADRANPELNQFNKPQESDRVTAYTIGAVTKKDGSHATVQVTISTKSDPAPTSAALPVKKEGGSWKVCVSDMLAGLPSSLPSGFPSTFPTGGTTDSGGASSAPTDSNAPNDSGGPSGFPTSLPGGSNICASSTDASTTATTYVGAAEIGFASVAQTCVWHDSVPQSTTAKLNGKLYSPKGDDKTGGNGHGPTAIYEFEAIDGSGTVTVTTTKEPDGKYYVTDVKIG